MTIQERRHEPRTPSQVKRTVVATVEDDAYGRMTSHLYLVDVSEEGIRINLDRVFEEDSQLKLTLPLKALGFGLEGEFEATCRVIWSRPVGGGMCLLGMQFVDLEEEHRETLRELIAHWVEKEGMELETLPAPVDAKFRFSEEDPWSVMVGVRAISKDGLRFPTGQAFTVGGEVQVRVLLAAGTIEPWTVVKWCRPMPNGAFDVGCEFKELSQGDESYIALHLKRCRHRPIC